MTDWSARILHGDCIAAMNALEAESIDAVVTDPPYGIEFMGRDWDKFIPHDEVTMSPRWKNAERADPSVSNWGDGESAKFGKLPSFGGRRTSYQCQGCGKRDAFRNPHKCDETGATDWRSVPSYAGASPEVLAFERFSQAWGDAAYRVLKPGGHLLAFGATRMYHRLAAGIEDAGFEIRDSLHWIYGSGFPKSLDVSKAIDKKAGANRDDREIEEAAPRSQSLENPKRHVLNGGTPVTEEAQQWEGWGTALKPAHEPIIMARKPLSGTVTETVLTHGTGAINIASARVGEQGGTKGGPKNENWRPAGTADHPSVVDIEVIDSGRWPANILLSHLAECEGNGPGHTDVLCAPGCPVAELNEASGESRSIEGGRDERPSRAKGEVNFLSDKAFRSAHYGDAGGAARFFYIAKPRTRERVGGTMRNLHPTVKPIDLMRHLVRLVTPPGGVVLDPFLGSGSTGCAAMAEGFRFIGIEQDAESFETSLARVSDYAFAHGQVRPTSETVGVVATEVVTLPSPAYPDTPATPEEE